MLKKIDFQNGNAIYDRNVKAFAGKNPPWLNTPYNWIWREDGLMRTLEICLDLTGQIDTNFGRVMTVNFPGRAI